MKIGERMWLIRNELCYSGLVYAALLNAENESMAIGFTWIVYLGKDELR